MPSAEDAQLSILTHLLFLPSTSPTPGQHTHNLDIVRISHMLKYSSKKGTGCTDGSPAD